MWPTGTKRVISISRVAFGSNPESSSSSKRTKVPGSISYPFRISSDATSSPVSGFTMCCFTRDFVFASRIWKWTDWSCTAEYSFTGIDVEPSFNSPVQMARADIYRSYNLRLHGETEDNDKGTKAQRNTKGAAN